MYAAMMIDLKKSKSYCVPERRALQEYIMEASQVLNGVFEKGLVHAVDFSAGDEIQGLFTDAATAYLYCRLFSMLVHPAGFRAGIGCGSWDIQIENKGTTAQDGQAFHRARAAIRAAAEQEDYAVLLYSGARIDETVNALVGMATALGNHMNAYQNELMLLTELLYPLTRGACINLAALPGVAALMQKKPAIPAAKERAFPGGGCTICPIAPVDIEQREASFYVTSGKTRGAPTRLAALLQISRQSVDRTLKYANIYTARNLAISALRAMTEIE